MAEPGPVFVVNAGSRVVTITLQGFNVARVVDLKLFSGSKLIAEWSGMPIRKGQLLKPLSAFIPSVHSLKALRLETSFESPTSQHYRSRPENTSLVRAGVSSFSEGGKVVRGWVSVETRQPVIEIRHHIGHHKVAVYYTPLKDGLDNSTMFFSLRLDEPATTGDAIVLRLGSKTMGRHSVSSTPSSQRWSATSTIRRQVKLASPTKASRVWIIGNGPSVRTDDLERIPGRDITFTFNRFHLSYERHSFRPDFVVAVDRGMVLDFGEEVMQKSEAPVLIASNYSSRWAAYKWRLAGHIPIKVRPGRTLVNSDQKEFSEGGSSVFVALQAAFAMEASEIILYGIDFDFKISNFQERGGKITASGDGNHFIKGYRSGKDWFPPSWQHIGEGFLNAAVYSSFEERPIINATRGGKLETFQRGDFDEIVGE